MAAKCCLFSYCSSTGKDGDSGLQILFFMCQTTRLYLGTMQGYWVAAVPQAAQPLKLNLISALPEIKTY